MTSGHPPLTSLAVALGARTYLDDILAAHRRSATEDRRDLAELRRQALGRAEPTRGFRAALSAPGLSVIAEVKRRSPSKGVLTSTPIDAAALAEQYRDGGAACLSVLTDAVYFGGSPGDLGSAREASGLPVLRKDFTVCEADVYDARVMGADAVLLIAAALDDAELGTLLGCANDVGLDVLVEVHDERELSRALAVGADLVGVNQRDLHTFQVDQGRAIRVGKAMPSTVVRVAESGVRGPEDAAVLASSGFDAVLVGESLVTHGDPAEGVRALRAAGTPGPVGEGAGACS